MIAEDDGPICELLNAILSSLGVRNVVQVHNGIQAYEEAAIRQYDLILMDVSMPQLSGIDSYRKIHAVYPQQKVVFVTGLYDEDMIGYLVKKENAFGYIKKPFDIQLIRDLIMCISQCP